MRQLAIYHAPQECGAPYVMLVNLEDGQPVGRINIPEGYWTSGYKAEEYYEPTGDIIRRKHSGNYLPETGKVEQYRRDKYIRLKEIVNVKSRKVNIGEGKYMEVYNATLVYEVCRRKLGYRFDSSKDLFRQEMEEQGIDMTGWCVYKRRKTEFMDFLRAILNDSVVNIIRIG